MNRILLINIDISWDLPSQQKIINQAKWGMVDCKVSASMDTHRSFTWITMDLGEQFKKKPWFSPTYGVPAFLHHWDVSISRNLFFSLVEVDGHLYYHLPVASILM